MQTSAESAGVFIGKKVQSAASLHSHRLCAWRGRISSSSDKRGKDYLPKNHKEKARKKEILSQAKRKKKLQKFEYSLLSRKIKCGSYPIKWPFLSAASFLCEKIALHGSASPLPAPFWRTRRWFCWMRRPPRRMWKTRQRCRRHCPDSFGIRRCSSSPTACYFRKKESENMEEFM